MFYFIFFPTCPYLYICNSCIFVYVCVYVYVCMYVCVYVYIYIDLYLSVFGVLLFVFSVICMHQGVRE